ncbi:MAG: type 1 glutamine amidotransferase [Peptococcaceae bacterium]|jgi:GMP synthase-like glutamine amidotransferase|nr:MAG: type 1 glutamine amidotransferase [Peptococcaceae bacterium]
MHILVVQNVTLEGPGLLGTAMINAGLDLDIRIMDQPDATIPYNLSNYKAMVVLGGPMNVYEEDDYPYLKQIGTLIKEAVVKRIPTLGICLGAQLIAKSLGAPVRRNRVKEIGWHKVRLTAASRHSPLFTGLPEEFITFQWHGDTFDLPSGSVHPAFSDACKNQAFSLGTYIHGLQFHPEVTAQMVAEWVEAYGDEIEEFGGAGASERLLAETTSKEQESKAAAEKFMANWLNIIAKSNPY